MSLETTSYSIGYFRLLIMETAMSKKFPHDTPHLRYLWIPHDCGKPYD